MSLADNIFKNMCEDIIANGTSTEGQKVRPHWDDGTPAYTIKKFGVVNRYDLREEFPAITFRKTAIKSATDEILWIFQKKSNNINDLNSHIWDEWADKNGSIGKAYGYQVGEQYIHHQVPTKGILFNVYEMYPSTLASFVDDGDKQYTRVHLDQIDAVLYDLKNNPFSRRIMTNLWNFQDLHEMNLQPCCWSCNFNVTDEGGDKLVLNMVLNQRSSDVLTANNWNVVQYAILLKMIAQVSNMEAGVLLHCITDAHIYDRHVDIVKEIINRETYPAPIVTLNPDIKSFYDFRTSDITVENYQVGGPQVSIPIAI